jgi:hypothetical protein
VRLSSPVRVSRQSWYILLKPVHRDMVLIQGNWTNFLGESHFLIKTLLIQSISCEQSATVSTCFTKHSVKEMHDNHQEWLSPQSCPSLRVILCLVIFETLITHDCLT